MEQRIHVVVGDEFRSFAEHDSILTFEVLQQQREALGPNDVIVLGQGLTLQERTALIAWASSHPSRPRVIGENNLCPTELTHKKIEENTLISSLVRLGPLSFQCDLMVTPAVDRLADHVTGQHVGGMLLIEAGRQACIAAIERQYPREGTKRWGFAWSRCESRFSNYAFPVPTEVLVTLHPGEANSKSRSIALSLTATLSQAGVTICEITNELNLVEEKLSQSLESRKARNAASQVVAAYLAEVTPLAKTS